MRQGFGELLRRRLGPVREVGPSRLKPARHAVGERSEAKSQEQEHRQPEAPGRRRKHLRQRAHGECAADDG